MLKETIRKEMRGAIDKYNGAQKEAKQAYEYLQELNTASDGLQLKIETAIANAAFEILNKPTPKTVQIKAIKSQHYGGVPLFKNV